MKKDKQNIIFPTESFARAKFSKNFLLLKENVLVKILKNHWENFLSTYQYSKKKKSFGFFSLLRWKQSISHLSEQKYPQQVYVENKKKCTEEKKFFYFEKQKCCPFNYLLLAKLLDSLGTTQVLHNKVCKLIRLYLKFVELEKVFNILVSKESLFLGWISYLLIQEISQVIKKTILFFYNFKGISPLGPLWRKKNKLEIQNSENLLFVKSQDFLILKWYKNKMQTWSHQVLVPSKEVLYNQNYEKLLVKTHTNNIIGYNEKIHCYSKYKTNKNYQTLLKKQCFDEKLPLTKISKTNFLENNLISISKVLQQRYLKLLKNILQKNKVSNQVELIQYLNKIIQNWDTFISNTLTKKNSFKLNTIIYQLLWRWGFVRHKKQKAKWIKKRYWSDFKKEIF